MRRSLHKLGFAIRIAFKNMISSPLKTVLMMIGFLGVFMVLLLSFSMKDFFRTYHHQRLVDTYQDYDLIMDVSQTGNSRFFSISQLNLDQTLDIMIEDQAMFFEFDVLLDTSQTQEYVHVYASNIENLEKISNELSKNAPLKDDEIIITSSFSLSKSINIGDEVTIHVKDSQKRFTVIDVVNDGKLFRNASVFIDKDQALPFFLSALSPTLESLPPLLLKNIYNKVYIDIDTNYTYEEVVERLKGILAYENLDYEKTIDEAAVEQYVQRNFSSFLMILSIVFLAILFVLETTLLVYFNDKRALFSTIHILGGKKRFSFNIIKIELFIIVVLSFFMSIGLTKAVINYGLNYLNSSAIYSLNLKDIGISLLIGVLVFYLVLVYYFIKYYKVSDVVLLKDIPKKEKPFSIVSYTLFALLFITYQILNLDQKLPVSIGYKALISIIIVVLLIFIAPSIFINTIDASFAKKKETSILFYQFRMLIQQSSFKHFSHMVLISFLTIFLLVFGNLYMTSRSDSYQDTYQVDFVLSQITRNYDQTYAEVLEIDEVRNASKAVIFYDVSVDLDQQNISQLVSMDQEMIHTYFNIEIDQLAIDDLTQDDRFNIVLPDRYQYIYDLAFGDVISIYVDGNYGYQDFHVSGFFEKQLGDLAFTNLHLFDDVIYNVILVNALNQKDVLRTALLDAFSDDLIAVIDVDDSMSHLIQDMQRVTIYITVVLSVIILCFIVTLMNHTSILYKDMENHYGKLFVLGVSKTKMIISLSTVFSIIFSIFFSVSALGYAVISKQLAFFGVLFGEYEPIKFNIVPIFYGGTIIITTYFIILVFYIHKVLKVNIAQIHRQYIS